MEQVDLTTPVSSKGGTTYWTPVDIRLHYDPNEADSLAFYEVVYRGQNGESLVDRVSGATAKAKIIAFNTTDLTSNSLKRRIISDAINRGVFAGTISGSPDA